MFAVYSEKAQRYQNEKLKTRNNNSPKEWEKNSFFM